MKALYNGAFSVFSKDLRQGETLIPPILTMQPKQYPHRKAILVEPSLPGGRWYVEYYIFNQVTESLVRKRKYKTFASLPNDSARKRYGKQICTKINDLLPYAAIGLPESIDKSSDRSKTYSLKKGINFVISVKYPIEKNRKTYLTFTSICARFELFCANIGWPTNDIRKINKEVAQQYIDHLTLSGISPNTVENQFMVFRLIWNQLVTRKIVEINPWLGSDRPKTIESDRNEAYSREEQKQLKALILDQNPKVWRIVRLLYYCFIRESELARLRVKDVDLQNRQIFISGTNSKNKKRGFVTMPDSIVEMFQEMKLQDYPGNYFLFTPELEPGKHHAYSSAYYKKYKKILDLTDIKEKTLYSWKHTGVVEAYKAGVNIKAIQLQCRHSSIEQTDIYLKSLGMGENTEFVQGIPEL
nr:site-specific integrase [uncultured Fluviicola sp.]